MVGDVPDENKESGYTEQNYQRFLPVEPGQILAETIRLVAGQGPQAQALGSRLHLYGQMLTDIETHWGAPAKQYVQQHMVQQIAEYLGPAVENKAEIGPAVSRFLKDDFYKRVTSCLAGITESKVPDLRNAVPPEQYEALLQRVKEYELVFEGKAVRLENGGLDAVIGAGATRQGVIAPKTPQRGGEIGE
jgi:hypothetical protein